MNLVRKSWQQAARLSRLCANVLETGRKIQPDQKPFNHGFKAAGFVENRPLRSQNAQPVQAAFAAFFVGDQS